MKKLAAVLAVAVLAVTGCAQKERVNAHQSVNVDRSPADVLAMPNYYNNVATKCDHGNRIYVTSNKSNSPSNLAVVPHDPSCPGGSQG